MRINAAAVVLLAGPAGAQQVASRAAPAASPGDSVEVVASDAYLAGGFHRFLLGGQYRRVWAAPIRVPLLDLRRFAGGLTPRERGGGFQTRSLQFTAADGREFRFRSLDKDPAQKLPPHLRTAAIERLVRDQTSALHPGAAVVAAALAEAAGVPQALHRRPWLDERGGERAAPGTVHGKRHRDRGVARRTGRRAGARVEPVLRRGGGVRLQPRAPLVLRCRQRHDVRRAAGRLSDVAPAVSGRRFGRAAGHGWRLSAGPFVRHARTDQPSLAVPSFGRGADAYTDGGLSGRFELDRRDRWGHPRGGVRLSAGAALLPGGSAAAGTYGAVDAAASTYLAPRLPLSPVLALRAGVARASGPYPWFDAPAVGGESSLRGFELGRFTGDGAAFAGAELRVVDPSATISATVADGERTMMYLRGGFAF